MHAAELVSFGSRVFVDVGVDGSVLSGLNSLVVVAAAPTNPEQMCNRWRRPDGGVQGL